MGRRIGARQRTTAPHVCRQLIPSALFFSARRPAGPRDANQCDKTSQALRGGGCSAETPPSPDPSVVRQRREGGTNVSKKRHGSKQIYLTSDISKVGCDLNQRLDARQDNLLFSLFFGFSAAQLYRLLFTGCSFFSLHRSIQSSSFPQRVSSLYRNLLSTFSQYFFLSLLHCFFDASDME